jgi:hypothetical protein
MKFQDGTIWPSYHQKMKSLASMVTEIDHVDLSLNPSWGSNPKDKKTDLCDLEKYVKSKIFRLSAFSWANIYLNPRWAYQITILFLALPGCLRLWCNTYCRYVLSTTKIAYGLLYFSFLTCGMYGLDSDPSNPSSDHRAVEDATLSARSGNDDSR